MKNEDIKHLDLLSLFHYIFGGITALTSCLPVIHVIVGFSMVSGKLFEESNGAAPPPFMGWIFVIFGTVFIVMGLSAAVCMIVAGGKLKRHKNRVFCMVVAGIECMYMPLGTVLGVFTLIALNKESIQEIFVQPSTEG